MKRLENQNNMKLLENRPLQENVAGVDWWILKLLLLDFPAPYVDGQYIYLVIKIILGAGQQS